MTPFDPADPDAADELGWTALHDLASLPGRQDTPPEQLERTLAAARRVIAARADLEARNIGGKTPLAIAAFLGHREMTELLLAAGADINSIDDNGLTILDACNLFVEQATAGDPRRPMDDATAATNDVIGLLIVRGARSTPPELAT